MREVSKIPTFEIVESNGKKLTFQFDDPTIHGARDIYANLYEFLVDGKHYRMKSFSRIDVAGKCRYKAERVYPPLKIFSSREDK